MFKYKITLSRLSIPSKIAEGYKRDSNKIIANLINFAKGYVGELRTQIFIGLEIGDLELQVVKTWKF